MTDLTFSMLDGREEKTNKQTNNINLDNFLRSQMLLPSNILCSKLTPWFGTEVSNIIIKSDACYLSLTHWTSLEASFSVCFADLISKVQLLPHL